MFTVARRGKFQRLVLAGGGEVQVRLYGCAVRRVNGEFVTLDLGALDGARSDFELLQSAAAEITRLARPAFEPLCGTSSLVAKISSKGGGLGGARWENSDGDPALPWALEIGRAVDVVVSPGVFGSFGSCWLVKRIKPHSDAV